MVLNFVGAVRARVAQINFVVLSEEVFAGSADCVVHSLDGRALLREWTEIERLYAFTLVEGFEANAFKRRWILLPSHFIDRVVDIRRAK